MGVEDRPQYPTAPEGTPCSKCYYNGHCIEAAAGKICEDFNGVADEGSRLVPPEERQDDIADTLSGYSGLD